jgi:ribosomal protein L11 methylase PrmA
MTVVDLRHHKADYGFDGDYRSVSAPTVATIVGTVSVGLLASAARSLARGKTVAAAVTGGTGASIVTTAALFIRTTRVGKFEVWAAILDGLRLRGDETLLDLGCCRGAVLLAAAKLLPNGRALGVDIWRADQTNNSQQNTLRNAELEGVADRVEVRTADITDLPFPDDSVDVIVSSLVVHNLITATKPG